MEQRKTQERKLQLDEVVEQLCNDGDGLRSHGVRVVQGRAVSVAPFLKTVRLYDNSILQYDRLVLSPGIDFIPITGWESGRGSAYLASRLTDDCC